MHDDDDVPAKRRRGVLKATGTALLLGSLAGCSSDGGGDGTPTDTPTATPTATTEPPATTSEPEPSTESEPSTDDESGDGGQSRASAVIEVGPDGDFRFEPGTDEAVYVTPGTEVLFYWASDSHNIVVESAPDGAEWEGHEPVENEGFEYRHTFETLGEYRFHCEPHHSLGMRGEIVVNETGRPPETGTEQPGSDEPVTLGDDGTAEIRVGAGGDYVFEPGTERPVSVPPGTRVTFVWESDNHNVHMGTMPEDSTWTNEDGVVFNAGHERTHTFEATGRYEFVCQPHESLGEQGVLLVEATE
ncbi:plastocyanin/azurin family copper-binding protein [Haloarchaeobius salinus]|uniref:plastocyanin/azurin family copper-binding protein n=1 Tax=Haloarchaeobius salinus TaxID=1198298 RepID=UPI00210B687C|nr:plastocyanin/azurin family copper-binding protein [Haloarchaeobius salinus]